jgi:rod shape determining protein RodA
MMAGIGRFAPRRIKIRVGLLSLVFAALVAALAAAGVVMLYGAAGGKIMPWAGPHAWRLGAGLALFVLAAAVDLDTWRKLAMPAYVAVIGLLVLVLVMGDAVMGARRWLDFGLVRVQPSEFVKMTLVLGLAAYYHQVPERFASRPLYLVVPLVMILVPVALIARQPDLGTGVIVLAGGIAVLFAAGLHWLYFAAATAGLLGAIPMVWQMLHGYQKQRILTFLDPSRDALGAGYHIQQSKIALGSGGLTGKGLGQGTQSQLDFLPEKHTDFIFTVLAEEMGFLGGIGLLALYIAILAVGFYAAFKLESRFARLLCVGLCCALFFYVFINVAMVTGLVPVVGVPLPLVSFGGTAVVAVMFALGLILNAVIRAGGQRRSAYISR